MARLTDKDLNAGISRSALDVLQKQNGNGKSSGRQTGQQIIAAYRATRVIDTPMRLLDVLESQDGRIIVRDTSFYNMRADVTQIFLDPHEAIALAAVIEHLEDLPAEIKRDMPSVSGKVVRA